MNRGEEKKVGKRRYFSTLEKHTVFFFKCKLDQLYELFAPCARTSNTTSAYYETYRKKKKLLLAG